MIIRDLAADGLRVLHAAKEMGADKEPVSARIIRRRTAFETKRFDAAVNWLLRQPPLAIQEDEEPIWRSA
jgi:hypothetical protein